MSFRIELQPSGRDFETIGKESILDAAFRSGVSLAYKMVVVVNVMQKLFLVK